jgi:hypothetical protein
MTLSFVLAATLAATGSPVDASPPAVETLPVETVAEEPPAPPQAPAALTLPKGTMVRLMVLNEVNSRDHRAGHRFVLRVDEDVKAGPVTVIPVGAKAWGEVLSAEGTGGVGKSGRLSAKLLYVEAAGQKIPLEGDRQSKGGDNTAAVVGAVVGLGILGLLTKGNNATLKAGEIINGYTVDDASFSMPAMVAR